ncbi:MAG: hypothetical protein V1914_04830 [archaeon]
MTNQEYLKSLLDKREGKDIAIAELLKLGILELLADWEQNEKPKYWPGVSQAVITQKLKQKYDSRITKDYVELALNDLLETNTIQASKRPILYQRETFYRKSFLKTEYALIDILPKP